MHLQNYHTSFNCFPLQIEAFNIGKLFSTGEIHLPPPLIATCTFLEVMLWLNFFSSILVWIYHSWLHFAYIQNQKQNVALIWELVKDKSVVFAKQTDQWIVFFTAIILYVGDFIRWFLWITENMTLHVLSWYLFVFICKVLSNSASSCNFKDILHCIYLSTYSEESSEW